MAGAVAIATSLRDSYWMRRFRKNGMRDYLFYYGFTIVCLLLTHISAVYALMNYTWFRITIASALMNTVQVLWVMYGAHRITEKANDQGS